MFEMLYIFIAVAGSIAIGLYDLKTSDVPDNAVYAMIAAGMILHLAESVAVGDIALFTDTLIVGSAFLLIGLAMYYTKQWGGGDSALLVAIGVLTSTLTARFFPFALSFFINLAVIGAFYSILYAIIIARRNGSDKIFFLLARKERKTIFGITGLLLIASLAIACSYSLYALLSVPVVAMLAMYFVLFVRSIDEGFRTRVHVSKLKEGDVIGEDIPKAGIHSKYIKGLTKKDIAKIKRFRKYVVVLDGVRYTPAFAISLIFTLAYGDILTLLFL